MLKLCILVLCDCMIKYVLKNYLFISRWQRKRDFWGLFFFSMEASVYFYERWVPAIYLVYRNLYNSQFCMLSVQVFENLIVVAIVTNSFKT